jgi:hypothetical protein
MAKTGTDDAKIQNMAGDLIIDVGGTRDPVVFPFVSMMARVKAQLEMFLR